MIETQEDKPCEEIDSSTKAIDEEWKKYNKRLDDLIDDVEIEAEMEAEKTIRSKNSRLVTISFIGLALITLIFVQIQHRSNSPEPITSEKALIEEASLHPQDAPSTAPAIPPTDQLAPEKPAPMVKTVKAPTKPENSAPRKTRSSVPKKAETVKATRSVPKKPITSTANEEHYVQLGAFSIKENAEKFSKKVKSKGFNTTISVREAKSTRHQVFMGNFDSKIKAEPKLAELKVSGFNPSIKKTNDAYTLELGLFRKDASSTSLIKKLRSRGFQPATKRVSVDGKTYIVRVDGLVTKKDARQTRQKLADLGFKNSFIR